jgi:hypothetical protein
MMDRFCTIIALALDNCIPIHPVAFVFRRNLSWPPPRCWRAAACLTLLGVCCAFPGCRHAPERRPAEATLDVGRFSAAQPGDSLLAGWRPLILSRFKKATQYRLVSKDGSTVVAAHASSSASGLIHDVDLDVHRFPWLQWRWRVPALIEQADSTNVTAEDSPARIVLSFAGDTRTLPFGDRLFMRQFQLVTGAQLPYATLMYIWENRLPPGTIVPNPHTPRIQMVVAQSGSAQLGKWVEERHNVLDDYRAAFGAEPGRVVSIGVMTDADNTGVVVDAYYGDIVFSQQLHQ